MWASICFLLISSLIVFVYVSVGIMFASSMARNACLVSPSRVCDTFYELGWYDVPKPATGDLQFVDVYKAFLSNSPSTYLLSTILTPIFKC